MLESPLLYCSREVNRVCLHERGLCPLPPVMVVGTLVVASPREGTMARVSLFVRPHVGLVKRDWGP